MAGSLDLPEFMHCTIPILSTNIVTLWLCRLCPNVHNNKTTANISLQAIGFFVIHKDLPVNSITVQALPHTIPTAISEVSVNTISVESMDQGMGNAQIQLWDSRHLSHQAKSVLACFEIFTLWYNSFGFFESSINLLIKKLWIILNHLGAKL